MNVLLVAYSFPPDPLVGSLRAEKVASAFAAAGHRVDVVTARLPAERGARRHREDAVTVHTVPSVPHPKRAYGWLARRRAERGRSDPGPAVRADSPASDAGAGSRFRAWLRAAGALLWVPDEQQGFVGPAVVRSLLLRRRIDLVYSTSPPHSDHLVGLILNRLTGVRWVMELRDPWWEAPNKLVEQSRAARAMNRWLERRCLRAADRVITVTDGIAEIVSGRGAGRASERPIVIRNGIDRLAPTAPTPGPGAPFRVLYLGNLYKNRDPLPFLRAVANVRKRRGLGPAELRIEFIGACEAFRGESVPAVVESLGLSDVVRVLPPVAHADGQAAMHRADLLLLLAQGQPAQVPNKLYEYLGSRRPILAITDEDGETTRLLRHVGGHFVVTDVANGTIEHALDAAVMRSLPPPASEAALRDLTAKRQMDALLNVLGAGR